MYCGAGSGHLANAMSSFSKNTPASDNLRKFIDKADALPDKQKAFLDELNPLVDLIKVPLAPELMQKKYAEWGVQDSNPFSGDKLTSAKGDVVAIFADYDGCFDLVNPLLTDDHQSSPGFFRHYKKSPLYMQERIKLIDGLKAITRGASKVILFVGSNRQSNHLDEILSWNTSPKRLPSDGSKATGKFRGFKAIGGGAFAAIAKEVGSEVSGKPWELNKALAGDLMGTRMASRDLIAWTNKEMAQASNAATGTAWLDEESHQPLMDDGNPEEMYDGEEDDLKWLLVQNNMKQLRGMGKVHAYFIDDRNKFLEVAGKKFASEKLGWGEAYAGLDFHTIHFDYMDLIMDGNHHALPLKKW